MEKVSLTFRKDSKNEAADKTSNMRQNVSFTFSKRAPKRLVGNKLTEDDNKYADRELITSVEDKEIKRAFPKEDKKKLTIRPLGKSTLGFPRYRDKSDGIASTNSLEEMAVKELLKETAAENEKWEKREFSNYTVTIPLIPQNKLPVVVRNNQDLDISSFPEPSSLEDHENVPVEGFAAAYFRGLGCEPGDPIGSTNKKYIAALEPAIRSKGLGLGADVKSKKKKDKSSNNNDKKEEELTLKKGSYVHVLQGAHEGQYGEVEGLDESRVIIKIGQQTEKVSLPLLYVDVVSKKEFKKESKVINRSDYVEYNKSHETRSDRDSKHSSRHLDGRQEDYPNSNEVEPSREDDHEYSKRKSNRDDVNHAFTKSHKKRSRSRSPDHSNKRASGNHDEPRREVWICPQLRVRFIDKQYKKGKYFNQKMTVEDVLSLNSCVCITEDGKYLEDINPEKLETVVPRSESSYVKVVMGKYKGQIGTILKRDKANCIATVNFLSDREKVVKLDYDFVCEYVGDASQFD